MSRQNTRLSSELKAIAEKGEVSVQDLAQQFGISLITVRRDLAQLAHAGLVNRTHGGAVASRAGVVEFSFQERESRQAAEKRAIGRRIASMVEPGMAVSLDTGTTTLEVARSIAGIGRVTVLTSSLAVASVLHTHEDIEVILLGGRVRKDSPDMDGPITEDNLKRFRVNLAVLAADGVSPDGVFVTTVGIARIAEAVMRGADRKVLAVDSSKFGRTAFMRYAALEEMDVVVTDSGCPAATRSWLEAKTKQVVYVDKERTE